MLNKILCYSSIIFFLFINNTLAQNGTFSNDSQDKTDHKKDGLSTENDTAMARKRSRDGLLSAKSTVHAGADENCDIWKDYFALLRGEICGKYYKVLEVDKGADKATIRKAYRAKSLELHPDKNPATIALSAFNMVREAYECLSDDLCRRKYDESLYAEELKIQESRKKKLMTAHVMLVAGIRQVHSALSVAASVYFRTTSAIWNAIGKWMIADIPIGRVALVLAIVTKLRLLLYLQAASMALLWFNVQIESMTENSSDR